MKRLLKNSYIWISSSMLVLLFSCIFLLVHGVYPFGSNYLITHDGLQQVYAFLCVLYDKIHSNDSLFYFWNGALGCNFLAVFFFYLSSPTNLILLFIDRSDILTFMTFSIFVRLALSAGTFAIYLLYVSDDEYNSRSRIMIIPFACAYALNNFMLAYYHESMWLDSFVMFPIVMMGYNKMIKQRKPTCYIISLALSAFMNFYIVYMIGLFLCIWFLFDEHKTVKKFFRDAILFAGSSLLAVCISAMPLLVSYLGASTTHAGQETIVDHEWYGNIFEVLRYQFVFSKLQPIGNSLNTSNIYAGTFVLVLVFVYAFLKGISIKVRIKKLLLILLLVISMDESVLNYIWHAFHTPLYIPNRFGFIFIFVLLELSWEAIALINEQNAKRAIIGVGCAGLYPIICFVFTDFDSIINSSYVIAISIVLILLYGFLFIIQIYNPCIQRVVFVVISLLIICELYINFNYSLSKEVKERKDYISYIHDAEEITRLIEEKDDGLFYRSDYVDNEVNNINSMCGVNGISTFSSFLPYMTYVYLNYNGILSGNNSIGSYGTSELMESLLGVKYIYVKKNMDYFGERYNYSQVYENDDFTVYKNNSCMNLGFAASNKVLEYEYYYNEPFVCQNEMAGLMTGNGDLYQKCILNYNVERSGWESAACETDFLQIVNPLDSENAGRLNISFDVEMSGEYYACFDVDKRNDIGIYVNDKYIRNIVGNPMGSMFYIGNLENNDKVNFVFDAVNGLVGEERVCVRIARLNKDAYNEFIEQIKTNQMNIEEMKSNKIIADVNISADQLLFTSIPYDKGWHAFENGNELKIDKIADEFVGIKLAEGVHKIEFIYIPPGLKPGLIISVLALCAFISYSIIKKH